MGFEFGSFLASAGLQQWFVSQLPSLRTSLEVCTCQLQLLSKAMGWHTDRLWMLKSES